MTGRLEVIIGDDFDQRRSEQLHFIRDEATGKSYELRFEGAPPPGLVSGAIVRAHGRARGHELFLESTTEASTGVSVLQGTTAEAMVSGPQNTMVIMLDFPGLPSNCSVATVENLMFTGPAGTTVDDLYQEMSSGLVSLSGPVVGPFTLQQGDPGTCNPGGWAAEADELAAAAGYNLNDYERKVYVVPQGTSCGYSGLGQVGGTSTRAWTLRCDVADVYAHELGHNFGWGHAGTASNEYADTSGIMGYSGNPLRHANGPHKTQIGWLGNARVQDVSSNGDYWVEALSLTDDEAVGPQVLRIPKADDGSYYYVSFRAPEGFDANLNTAYRYRMMVHNYRGSGSSQTYLVASLADGGSWTDSANGITVTRLSTSGNAVLAQMSFAGGGSGCSAQTPTLSLSPSSQSGFAGTALNYSMTLTNQDGTGCGPSTFNLGASAPSGWTTSLSPASLTLAPGSNGAVTLSVASSSTAPAGRNTLTVSASDSARAGHGASASAVYEVVSSCTSAAPAVTLSPDRQSGEAGTSRSYSVSVTNRDSAACQATTFSLSALRPSGWSGSVSTSSLSLAPGASGSATLNVAAPSSASAGEYAVGVGASSTVDAAHAASASGVFEVTAAPPPAPPAEDVQAPTAPTGLVADAKRKNVNVSWSASTDNVGVVGYRLLRDGGHVADLAGTSYADKAGVAGSAYSVVAYDAAGNVSPASASVVASVSPSGGSSGGQGGKGGGPKK